MKAEKLVKLFQIVWNKQLNFQYRVHFIYPQPPYSYFGSTILHLRNSLSLTWISYFTLPNSTSQILKIFK